MALIPHHQVCPYPGPPHPSREEVTEAQRGVMTGHSYKQVLVEAGLKPKPLPASQL